MSNKDKLYECELCTEKMIDNYRVICSFCNVEICESCFQYSITMELKNPVCIYCKKQLSLEYVLENNDTDWCKSTFIPYFENLCLEKEKNYLIDTMPEYTKMVKIRELRKKLRTLPSNKKIESNLLKSLKLENENITNKDDEFKKILYQEINEKDIQKTILNEEIDILSNDKKKIKKKKKIQYISNCPNDSCRGFITSDYFCEICNTQVCKLCMVEKEENHTCKRDDIESAELIRNSSKPCPKCYVPIFKISGCNQMFCTNCHVVFDWNTLAIDNGNVHNAHYFDWITSQNNEDNVNLDEIACGDIQDIFRNLYIKLRHEFNSNKQVYYDSIKLRKIFDINRIFNGEIITSIREKSIKDNFETYRIEYLDQQINEKKWKSKIARDTISNEKYRSLIEVLEMYITVTSDFIRQLAYNKITLKTLLKNYEQFYIHFDKSIDDVFQIFGGNMSKRLSQLMFEGSFRNIKYYY